MADKNEFDKQGESPVEWTIAHVFTGPVFAEMAEEAVKSQGIPCLLQKDFLGSAYGVHGTDSMGMKTKLLVPGDRLAEALQLIAPMITDSPE